jgi:hypothetical protein
MNNAPGVCNYPCVTAGFGFDQAVRGEAWVEHYWQTLL